MGNVDELARQMLGLPLDQRADLAERLLESLDQPTPEELEQLWAAEAERRYQAHKDGRIESFDGAEVHRQVIAEIK
jgi:putative addiction module component (TIGR02574 family)